MSETSPLTPPSPTSASSISLGPFGAAETEDAGAWMSDYRYLSDRSKELLRACEASGQKGGYNAKQAQAVDLARQAMDGALKKAHIPSKEELKVCTAAVRTARASASRVTVLSPIQLVARADTRRARPGRRGRPEGVLAGCRRGGSFQRWSLAACEAVLHRRPRDPAAGATALPPPSPPALQRC